MRQLPPPARGAPARGARDFAEGGRDRQIRETRERTRTLEVYNPVAEQTDQHEVTTRTRPYAVLSLAAHHDQSGGRVTAWHRLIVWNVDRMEWFKVRMARKGDRVRVRGYEETITVTGDDGQERQLKQVVVTAYEVLHKEVQRRHRIRRQRPVPATA